MNDSGEKWEIDPDQVEQVVAERAASKRKRPAPKTWRRLGTFVPRAWELRLSNTNSPGTERLARELLYLRWRNEQGVFGRKGEPITVSNAVAKAAKLSPRSKSRALAELQRLGLIRLDRGPRRSPKVFLLRVPASPSALAGLAVDADTAEDVPTTICQRET